MIKIRKRPKFDSGVNDIDDKFVNDVADKIIEKLFITKPLNDYSSEDQTAHLELASPNSAFIQEPTLSKQAKKILSSIAEKAFQVIKSSAYTMAYSSAIYYMSPYVMQIIFKAVYEKMTPEQVKSIIEYGANQLSLDDQTSKWVIEWILKYSLLSYFVSPIVALPNIVDGAKFSTHVAVNSAKAIAPYVPVTGAVAYGLTYAYDNARHYGYQAAATAVSTAVVAATYLVNRPSNF